MLKRDDTYGHQEGDLCLRRVAQCFNKSSLSHDLAARYGGEEFAIVLSYADAKAAEIVATRMYKLIRNLEILHSTFEVSDRVTISSGVISTSMDTVGSIKNHVQLSKR